MPVKLKIAKDNYATFSHISVNNLDLSSFWIHMEMTWGNDKYEND